MTEVSLISAHQWISRKIYSDSVETSGCGHLSIPDSSYAGKWVTLSSYSSSPLVSCYLLLRLASKAAYVKVPLLISVKMVAVILKASLLTMSVLTAVGQGEFTWVIWLTELRGKYLHDEQEVLISSFNLWHHQSWCAQNGSSCRANLSLIELYIA